MIDKELDERKEEQAQKYYDDAMWYYKTDELQRAIWLFEKAYDMTDDLDFAEECKEMIEECEKYLKNL